MLLAVSLTGVSILHAQVPAASRTFLLFVDDLHLEFRSTPVLRDLARGLVARLTRDGDQWAIVTPGTSSVSLAPTADIAAVEAEIRRVTGGGMPPRQFLDARQQVNGAAELRLRSAVAQESAARAIAAVTAAREASRVTVLYLSDGYDAGLGAASGDLLLAAAAANAQIYPIDARRIAARSLPQGTSQIDVDTVLESTRDSLITLAAQTGGVPVLSAADLDTAVSRIAASR